MLVAVGDQAKESPEIGGPEAFYSRTSSGRADRPRGSPRVVADLAPSYWGIELEERTSAPGRRGLFRHPRFEDGAGTSTPSVTEYPSGPGQDLR